VLESFKYEIGGKKYTQNPLVLGQVGQLMRIVEGMVIPSGVDTLGLISALGDKLPLAIAIVLTPEGVTLKDKDIHALASELEFEMPPEMAIQVIEDFFTCNPIQSLLERIGSMAGKIAGKIQTTGSKPSSASSAEETLQSETASSGVLH